MNYSKKQISDSLEEAVEVVVEQLLMLMMTFPSRFLHVRPEVVREFQPPPSLHWILISDLH